MIAWMGEFGLWAALACSLAQILFACRGRIHPTANALFAFVSLSFVALMVARVSSDFSLLNVAQHSNLALPMLYKIAGTWGNHEGSLLLWCWVMAGYGVALSRITRLPPAHHTAVMGAYGAICTAMCAFIALTSSPFVTQSPAPADGAALNPLLQDIGLAMHPPLLYLGFVGMGALYALAIGAVWRRALPDDWAAIARPFLMFSWGMLTLGVGLGSWWAYRELGWGGWWFWDPVENASIMPWLAATALLHAHLVLEKRGTLARWVLGLCILSFALSLLGTFLVRSGVITSVHSFASDPTRGLGILAIFTVLIGGALALFCLRPMPATSLTPIAPLSREGMILVGNMLLLVACASVIFGTLYPMFAEWMTGTKLFVGPRYFRLTAVPMMALPLLLAGLSVISPWGQFSAAILRKKIALPFLLTLLVAVLALWFAPHDAALVAAGLSLSTWLMATTLPKILRKRPKIGSIIFALGHGGVAVLIAGITLQSLYSQETQVALKSGASAEFAGFTWEYIRNTPHATPNYIAVEAQLRVSDNTGEIAALRPQLRLYPLAGATTYEAAIDFHPLYDLYSVIAQANADSSITLRLYYQPFIAWIWLGCAMIGASGLLRAGVGRAQRIKTT